MGNTTCQWFIFDCCHFLISILTESMDAPEIVVQPTKVKQVKGMKGYYEFSGDGTSKYISQKNKKNQKHGECFEFEGNTLKRVCEYDSDVLMCVIVEFHGETMVEKDNGTRVYEGGYKGEMRTGFWRDGKGTEYDKNGRITYEGEWSNGWKRGRGKKYSDNNPENETEWYYNYDINTYLENMRNCGVDESSTELVVDSDNLIDTLNALVLSPFSNLESIRVGISHLVNVHMFEVSDLEKLETIEINENCMSSTQSGNEYHSLTLHDCFKVVKCHNLNTITIGDCSFSRYQSFELDDLPSLEFIILGNNCFGLVENVTIHGFEQLKQIRIGKGCFTVCLTEDKISKSVVNGALTISDCRALDTIMVGAYSFSSFESFNVGNLESLNVIGLGDCCFYHAQSFSLESITIG